MQHAVLIGKLRRLVQSSMAKHAYESAVFFADKLVTLTHEEPEEIFRLAQVDHSHALCCVSLWIFPVRYITADDLAVLVHKTRALPPVVSI